MKFRKLILHFIIISLFTIVKSAAQPIADSLLTKKWNAFWIQPSDPGPDKFQVVHFRKAFQLSLKPSTFVVHVSADNRYQLYVNGSFVSMGPARSDTHHWNFVTLDIAPYLKAGNNSIASVVWNFGTSRPLYQTSYRTAFILQGNGAAEEIINSNSTWRFYENSSYTPLTPEVVNVYYALGAREAVNYNVYPTGWQLTDYNDHNWKTVNESWSGTPKGVWDWEINWQLVPQDIPPMELTPQRFQAVRKTSLIKLDNNFPENKISLTIEKNAKHIILLDHGSLTNAYPVIEFKGGKNAVVKLTYSEGLYLDEGTDKPWRDQQQKGNRNEIDGKRIIGPADQFIADGQAHTFSPLNWHTFRYLQLEITTQDEALVIDDISSIFTAYPFNLSSSFNSNDPSLTSILKTGWHTARLCAEESYMDTPFYERLQYFGDTRIQSVISLFNTTDDRLVRRAITMGDISRLSEGVTLSRYPSASEQIIPPFSLYWIGMLYDYYRYGKDPAFVERFLPGERQVLSFFDNYKQDDGRLKNAPFWQFTDWVEAEGWSFGTPPMGNDGCSALLDLQLLSGYQMAAYLEREIGMQQYAEIYEQKAAVLAGSIMKNYWDSKKQMLSDTKEKKYFSQHSNAMAILTGLVVGDTAKQVALHITSHTSLTPASIYFKYYINQALAKAGLGNTYLQRLHDWKTSLYFGLTTFPEYSNVNTTRSDCHAWSASPNIEFYRIVLGIDSDGASFKTITIEPHLGTLKKASGSIPHPQGEIKVEYAISKGNKLSATITIPPNTSGRFKWNGVTHTLKPGVNSYSRL